MPSLSIIIPAYNEQASIIPLLKAIKTARSENPKARFEVIVVNDSSTDGTLSLLSSNNDLYDVLVSTPKNSGKGGAVLEGLSRATSDFVLFQDADLEYSPKDYPALLRPVLDLDADVVIGSRFAAPQLTRVHYFWNKVGNKTITTFFNVLNNTTFTDIYSCYLVYRRSLLDPMELRYKRWEQHGEILTLAVRRGARLFEVPISYFGRTYQEGKKIRGYHIFSIFITLFLTRIRKLRSAVTSPDSQSDSA